MFSGISIWQLLIVMVIIVLLFGTKKLRNIGGDLGGAIKGFKNSMKEAENKADAEAEAEAEAEKQKLEDTKTTIDASGTDEKTKHKDNH